MIRLVLGKQALYPGHTCLGQAGLPDVWGRQVSQMSGAGRSSWETLPASKVCFFGPSVSEPPGIPEGIRHPFTLPPAKGTYLLKTCHSL